MANPLLPTPPTDNSGNPLIAGSPTLADAWQYNADAAQNWIAQQRAESVRLGLVDPQTGWPTKAGLVDAARQYTSGMLMGTTAPGAAGLKLPVRAPSEDVGGVINAQYNFGRSVGPQTVPIDSLSGGVTLSNPQEASRVAALKAQMSGPDGYISRPIVDTDGNVIEGQHRLEALRQLGVQNVPVHVIQDLAANVDEGALHGVVKQAQGMHSDQRHQLIGQVLEAVADEGSPGAVRDAYDPPRGYEPAWNAALDYLDRGARQAPGSPGLVAPAKGIVAYHGSPHDFDAFDLSKIGTGEGAQAYGHGLYFAGNEGVAQGYRDALSNSDISVAGKPYDAKNLDHFAALTLRNYPDDQAAIADMQRQAADFRKIRADWAPEAAQSFQATADRIKQGNLPTISETPHGRMYEVNLNVEPQQLLDWDKPLAQQAQEVKGIANTLQINGGMAGRKLTSESPGSDIWHAMRSPNAARALGYDQWSTSGPADYLKDTGIPGIQYLDQGSRAAGEGSRNYVMFDPKLVRIVRKYAIPAALLSGTTPGLLASPDE